MDNPRSKLLRFTPEQEKIVDLRTQDNAVVRNNKFNPKHILEALCELRYYLIIVAIICINMANGGLLFFSAQFVQTLGNFTVTQSTLLKVAAAAIAMLMSIISGLIAWRAQQNIYTGILMCTIGLAGTLILIFIPDGAIKLLGYYLSWGLAEALPMLAAIIGSNVSGYSKKNILQRLYDSRIHN